MAITAAEIKDQTTLEAWITSFPGLQQHSISLVLASRTALRVLPILGSRPPNTPTAQMLLETLRAIIISRVALKSPSQALHLAASSQIDSANFSYGSGHASTSNAARFAAYTSTASTGSDAAHFAAQSAQHAHDAANDDIWEAISADAKRLENARIIPLELINAPLWPNGPSEFWSYSMTEFQGLLIDLGRLSPQLPSAKDDWSFWFEWLESVANGHPSFFLPRRIAEALDKRIALGDDSTDFWRFESPFVGSSPISGSGFLGLKGVEANGTVGSFDGIISQLRIRTPDLINSEIAGWVAEARLQAAKKLPPELLSETELPESFPEVPQFTRGPDGKIRMEADPPNPRASRTEQDLIELHEEAREKAIALGKLSPNQLGLHKDIVHKFIEHLQQNLSDVSINRLWSKAQSLRHIMAIHLAEMQKPKNERETSYLLESEFATKLADAIEQYNVFNVADNRGRQLDLERHGPEARKMAEDALAIAKNILPELEDIVEQRSLQQTIEENEIAANTSTTLPIDQEKQRVAKLDANLFIQVLRVARQIAAKFSEAGAEMKIGATEQFLNLAGPHGLEIIAFVTKHHDAILAFASALKIAGGVGALLAAIVYLMK